MNDCKIVRDLLPNYIEKLTSDETNKYIENHLLECNDCKKILDNMKKELKVNNENDYENAKYMKKYNKKLKIFVGIIIILLIVIIAILSHYVINLLNNNLTTNQELYDMYEEGMYPEVFYARIEKIEKMSDLPVFAEDKTITVQGLDINNAKYRDKFYFDIDHTHIGTNVKIQFNGQDIDFSELKEGQIVAIYSYNLGISDNTDPNYLPDVRKIEVIDNQL